MLTLKNNVISFLFFLIPTYSYSCFSECKKLKKIDVPIIIKAQVFNAKKIKFKAFAELHQDFHPVNKFPLPGGNEAYTFNVKVKKILKGTKSIQKKLFFKFQLNDDTCGSTPRPKDGEVWNFYVKKIINKKAYPHGTQCGYLGVLSND